MEPRTLTEHIEQHIASRQKPGGVPNHEVDQINAAALDGAELFDEYATVGRQNGAVEGGPVDSRSLFDRLAERYGDPLTELHACTHLASTPSQPGFIHGAAPQRVFCKTCFATFLLTERDVMKRYAALTDCDACGVVVKDFHPGNISNGIVTYIIHVCADCIPPGHETLGTRADATGRA